MSAHLVAPRRPPARNGMGCKVCDLSTARLQAVNTAIWDGTTVRVRSYRERGREAYLLASGASIEVKAITRHAEHVEATWHEDTDQQPARSSEVAVFPVDYESLVEKSAQLSSLAMDKLTADLDELPPRELLGAAKLGVVARTQQESNRINSNKPEIQLTAIFGLASGHLAELPESEVVNVTPESQLLDVVRKERAELERRARED